MSGNLLDIFTTSFNAVFGTKPDHHHYGAPYDTPESLAYADDKLARGICPECGRGSSMTKTADDDGTHTLMCCKCGAQYHMTENNDLLKLSGYHSRIHQKYQKDIADELASIHRQATYNLEVQARKAA